MNLLIKLVHVCGFVERDHVWYYLHATVCVCVRACVGRCVCVKTWLFVCGVFVHVSVWVHTCLYV